MLFDSEVIRTSFRTRARFQNRQSQLTKQKKRISGAKNDEDQDGWLQLRGFKGVLETGMFPSLNTKGSAIMDKQWIYIHGRSRSSACQMSSVDDDGWQASLGNHVLQTDARSQFVDRVLRCSSVQGRVLMDSTT